MLHLDAGVLDHVGRVFSRNVGKQDLSAGVALPDVKRGEVVVAPRSQIGLADRTQENEYRSAVEMTMCGR